jgi:hypothetical protein
MERARHTERYRGHELLVEAWEQRAGVWSWTYRIDDSIDGKSGKAALLPTADAAIKRGILAARARAELL